MAFSLTQERCFRRREVGIFTPKRSASFFFRIAGSGRRTVRAFAYRTSLGFTGIVEVKCLTSKCPMVRKSFRVCSPLHCVELWEADGSSTRGVEIFGLVVFARKS